MIKTTRSLKTVVRLAAAAAFASAATWAGAVEVTLASLSAVGSAGTVQDMGRIDVGAAYDAEVKQALVRHARHPDASRSSPRRLNGKVDVDFEVNPDGSLKHAEVVQSSRSNALDGAALRTVQLARFQPMPAQPQHDAEPRRYSVRFDYRY